MKKNIIPAVALSFALLVCGCGSSGNGTLADTKAETQASGFDTTESSNTGDGTGSTAAADISDVFSNRDFEVGYDESTSALIQLNGNSASSSSNAVQISGSTVTITDEGTYILSGTLDDGMIIVDSEKTDKTQIVLDGVSIRSETSAPIYIKQSDKVFITLADGTENTLTNGGTFTAIDENNIDAAIFSKEDLTINGSGSLIITSPAGHGIVSKDSLKITSGTYDISSASHGLSGKDDVCIANAAFIITSGKDGIHAENADDDTLGYVYIQSGTFRILAEGDGISAASVMEIVDGTFDITSGGGSVNAEKQTSDSWGGFMGGPKHPEAGMGMEAPSGQMPSMDSADSTDTGEDSTSIKGIKANDALTIDGGNFTINSADDSVHSNTSITVNGGTFAITSGDDGFHADDTLTVTGGEIQISESYEGLEALHVNVEGGNISVVASDDGLNAAGGSDSSGMGGARGGDSFGKGGMSRGGMDGGSTGGSTSGGSIVISGGTVYIQASADGIDANGTVEITGGFTTVCGPTTGDTTVLDYDSSCVITGGTFIGTGSANMAQTFSDSEQGVISIRGGGYAGTEITLADSQGNVILSRAPELDFDIVIFSSPELIKGETYTITVGSAFGEFEAS